MGAVARGGGGNKRGKITALAIIEVFTKTWERRPLPNEEAPKEPGKIEKWESEHTNNRYRTQYGREVATRLQELHKDSHNPS